MRCSYPMKGFVIGKTNKGKKDLKICSYDTHHIEYRNGKWMGVNNTIPKTGSKIIREFVEIPCGQCIACRINKTRQWVARCLAEKKYHENSCFITLTYNDENLPTVQKPIDEDTGTTGEIATLNKRDYQLFIKRLRKKIAPTKIKYLISGEYGSKTFRPHYHMIIFGWKPNDLTLWSSNWQGNAYYNSEMLQEIWPKGFVVVGEVSDQSISYVARYTIKKIGDGTNKIYEEMNLEPPFIESSNGLGAKYYEENKQDILLLGTIKAPGEKGGITLPVPKYYKEKLEEEFPEEYNNKKEISKINNESTKHNLISQHKGLEYAEILQIEDEERKAKTKILKGGLL